MLEKLDAATTALVLIDLQKGVAGMTVAPHSAADVIGRSVALAERFRARAAPVVLVHVAFAPDFSDALRQPVDAPMPRPAGAMPADWSDIVPELAGHPGDIRVLKRQWGAFYGTDLDLHLRRRGVKRIVLGGIATNFGVESTARDAWEHGYEIVFAEDAMASMGDMHRFAIESIFPRLGRIRSTAEILEAMT